MTEVDSTATIASESVQPTDPSAPSGTFSGDLVGTARPFGVRPYHCRLST